MKKTHIHITAVVVACVMSGLLPIGVTSAQANMAPKYSQAQEAITAVKDWARAWSSQEPDRYLAHYSEAFVPGDGKSREAWVTTRQSRLTKPEFIMVGVGDFNVAYVDDGNARISFTQEYRSDRYASESRKEFAMVHTGSDWLIVSERVIREDTLPVNPAAGEPVTPVELNETELEAALPAADCTYRSIKSAVSDNWHVFLNYFDEHTASDPYARGDITMQLTISKNGRVIGTTVLENTAGGEELSQFVVDNMQSWHFVDVAPGVFKVKIPFKHTLRQRIR